MKKVNRHKAIKYLCYILESSEKGSKIHNYAEKALSHLEITYYGHLRYAGEYPGDTSGKVLTIIQGDDKKKVEELLTQIWNHSYGQFINYWVDTEMNPK